jgi:hypothetical protein
VYLPLTLRRSFDFDRQVMLELRSASHCRSVALLPFPAPLPPLPSPVCPLSRPLSPPPPVVRPALGRLTQLRCVRRPVASFNLGANEAFATPQEKTLRPRNAGGKRFGRRKSDRNHSPQPSDCCPPSCVEPRPSRWPARTHARTHIRTHAHTHARTLRRTATALGG